MKLLVSEASHRSGISAELIERFILFSWIRTADDDHFLLDECDIARCHLIYDLQEEFGVNDAAIPIILDLIDQLHSLRGEIRKSEY